MLTFSCLVHLVKSYIVIKLFKYRVIEENQI